MELSNGLQANLRELASAGPVELRENGARVAALSALSWDVRGNGAKPLPNFTSVGKLDGMPIPPRVKNFSITIRQSGPASLIDVVGSLTLFESAALRQAITNLIAEKRRDIVLNLSGLEYLDSSGIGELVRNYLTVIKSGGSLKVVGLSNKVEEILKITQLYKVFPEFPDEEAALKSYPENSGSSKS